MRNDQIPERRLTNEEIRALVNRAKAQGLISVRTDVPPVVFHGKMAYVPRAKRAAVNDVTGAPRRVVRQVAVSVPTSGVPVPPGEPA